MKSHNFDLLRDGIQRWLVVFDLDGNKEVLPMVLVETPHEGLMLRAETSGWPRTCALSPLGHLARDAEGVDVVGVVRLRMNNLAITSGSTFSLFLPVVTGEGTLETFPAGASQ